MRRNKDGYICQVSLPFSSNMPRQVRTPKPAEFEVTGPGPIPREARCLVMEEPPADGSEQEKELRALWTRKGISEARQDELIEELEAKAKPGAQIGPWKIGQ